jgi:hypothetical protein
MRASSDISGRSRCIVELSRRVIRVQVRRRGWRRIRHRKRAEAHQAHHKAAEYTITVGIQGLGLRVSQSHSREKKNRRKDTIENMLQNLYSPLYEILRRARYETSDFKAMVIAEWNNKGREGPRDCVLSEEQLVRVREIVERFGHYMDSDEQARLTKVLSNPDSIGAIHVERLKQPQHLFLNSEIDQRFDYIKERRDTLRKELEHLIKAPR